MYTDEMQAHLAWNHIHSSWNCIWVWWS